MTKHKASKSGEGLKAGIYLIRHTPSGSVYIGQANNVEKRWREHKRKLTAGTHHNKGLQRLWHESRGDDFEYELYSVAPGGLSDLECQRWLVKEERKYVNDFKSKGIVLNEAEPEIVETAGAIVEYEAKLKASSKAHDRRISEKRSELKRRIENLANALAPDETMLLQLRYEYEQKGEAIRRATGWRRLFHGRPTGFNLHQEKAKLEDLHLEISALSPIVNKAFNEIQTLKEERRHLHSQFTKVAKGRLNRFSWYTFRRSRPGPSISE